MLVLVVAAVALMAGAWSFCRPRRLLEGRQASGAVNVSIVIPARNEEANLPRLLASLAASAVAPGEVIVVDDGSTDDTAAVAAGFGVIVVVAPPPPVGWVGKTWACHLGSQQARLPVLLFLDADTWLAPGALGAIVAQHNRSHGLLSVQPHHHVRRAYERLSAVFNLVSLMGSGAFGVRIARPMRVAFGPCLVTSTADYARVGGHEGVRNEVVEDMALAVSYADASLPVTCLLGGDLVGFRMYPTGLRSLVQGWTKNISSGAARAPVASVLPAVVWVAAASAVSTSFFVGLVGWASGSDPPLAAAVAWVVVTVHIATMLRRVGSFGAVTAILFCIPVAFFIVVFVRSMVVTALRRPVQWRGRDVLARVDRDA